MEVLQNIALRHTWSGRDMLNLSVSVQAKVT